MLAPKRAFELQKVPKARSAATLLVVETSGSKVSMDQIACDFPIHQGILQKQRQAHMKNEKVMREPREDMARGGSPIKIIEGRSLRDKG